MADTTNSPTISLNARAGAAALALGGPLNLLLHLQGPRLGPLSYVAWLIVSFGALCFCQEIGADRPLNRAGLVLFAAAFCAATLAMLSVDPAVIARAKLLYAFTSLGAVIFWSVALMHRTQGVRTVGAIGTALAGGALILLIAAHLLVGAATIFGFSQLFVALEQPARAASATLAVMDAIVCVWCLGVAGLLWTGRIRS